MILWVSLEVLFYHIACEAKVEYEKDLIKQANSHYQEILNVHVLRDTLRHSIISNNPINPENKAEGFYSKALEKMEKENIHEARYEINETDKLLHYIYPVYITKSCLECHQDGFKLDELRGGIRVEMDASFTLDRTREAWYHFYLVSALTALLVFMALLFIFKLNRQKLHYLRLNIRLERKLQQKIQKLNQVLKASGLGHWEWNVQTDEHTVDNQWLNILGLNRRDVDEKVEDWKNRIDPDDLRHIMPIVKNAIKNKEPYVVEFRMRHFDGHYIWIQGAGGVTKLDEKGEVLCLSGTHQDITQRKLLELEQKHNESYLNTLFEKNPNVIIVTDGKEIIKANDAFFWFFNQYDSLEMFKKEHNCICDFFQSSPDEDFITSEYGVWVEEVMASLEPVAKILYLTQEYYFAVHARKVYDEGSMNVIVTFNDITETYKLKKRFEELSIIDELTEIYNRRYFNKIFKDEFNRAQREAHSFCFAIMDIDNFKLYNDHYGHDEGDIALKALADEIQASIKRSNEFFFRLGGEEFGIILSHISKEKTLDRMQTICRNIEGLNIEHVENLPSKKLTISIGMCYLESVDEMDLKQIYRHADQALYLAKERGRNRVELFNSES